jgi:hypothetical protein
MTTRVMCVDDLSGEIFEWRWKDNLQPELLADSSPTVADVRLNIARGPDLHDPEASDDELHIIEHDTAAAAVDPPAHSFVSSPHAHIFALGTAVTNNNTTAHGPAACRHLVGKHRSVPSCCNKQQRTHSETHSRNTLSHQKRGCDPPRARPAGPSLEPLATGGDGLGG